MTVETLWWEADAVSGEALARAGGLLETLSPEQQRAVEELARAIARGIAGVLIGEAERHPELAEIYLDR